MANTTPSTTALVPVTTPTLTAINGHGWATSLQVAEHFGKQHRNVLRDIRSMDIPESDRALNFELTITPVLGPKGAVRDEPMYKMTRDGFVLLAMGFTGKEAMRWKLAYIKAFNQLEQAYLEQLQDTAQKALNHREFRKGLKLSDRFKLREAAGNLLDDLMEETNPGLRTQKWLWLRDVNQDLGIETVPMDRLFDQEGGAA